MAKRSFNEIMFEEMPRWSKATIGILLAITLVLKIGGLDIAVQRMANAIAVQIEQRIDVALESKLVKRFDSIDVEIKDLRVRVTAIERENKVIHKSYHKD